MRTIILAAGYATRLYPLTKDFPKPLLEVGGKTILDWLIEDVSGVTEGFTVVTNHRFARIFEEWAAKRPEKIDVVDDGTETNETRLGAVRDIKLGIGGDCDHLVMAGDNVLDFSLVPFIEFARDKDASCVMCHREDRPEALRKTAVISVDDDRRITSYEEKPKEPKGNLAVPPFYYYKYDDIMRIDEALEDGAGFDAPGSFAAWLSRKKDMYAWQMTGSRHDIGDLASYEAVRDTYRGPSQE